MITRLAIALALLLCLGAVQREGPDLSAMFATPTRHLPSPKGKEAVASLGKAMANPAAPSLVIVPTNQPWASWTKPADASITGYTLYWGTSQGQHPNAVDCGMTNRWPMSSLPPAAKRYIVCRSHTSFGLESPDSNEAFYPVDLVVTAWGTNLQASATLAGPWTNCPSLVIVTNPNDSMLYYRSRTLTSTNRNLVTTWFTKRLQ